MQMTDEVKAPDVPPDRLSIDPSSRHFDETLLERGVGIRFKGRVRTNVQEYCISEGWVKMSVGKSVDRSGRPLTVKSRGPVEAWFEDLGDEPPVARQGGATEPAASTTPVQQDEPAQEPQAATSPEPASAPEEAADED